MNSHKQGPAGKIIVMENIMICIENLLMSHWLETTEETVFGTVAQNVE